MPRPTPGRGIDDCDGEEDEGAGGSQAATVKRNIRCVGWQPGDPFGTLVLADREQVQSSRFVQALRVALFVPCTGRDTRPFDYGVDSRGQQPPAVPLPVARSGTCLVGAGASAGSACACLWGVLGVRGGVPRHRAAEVAWAGGRDAALARAELRVLEVWQAGGVVCVHCNASYHRGPLGAADNHCCM